MHKSIFPEIELGEFLKLKLLPKGALPVLSSINLFKRNKTPESLTAPLISNCMSVDPISSLEESLILSLPFLFPKFGEICRKNEFLRPSDSALKMI